MLTLLKKYLYRQIQCSKIWDSKFLDLIAQEVRAFGMNPKVGGRVFCLKNFDTFTRTPDRVSQMNAVARAQLTYQMLTLLQRYTKMRHNLKSYSPYIQWQSWSSLNLQNAFHIYIYRSNGYHCKCTESTGRRIRHIGPEFTMFLMTRKIGLIKWVYRMFDESGVIWGSCIQ